MLIDPIEQNFIQAALLDLTQKVNSEWHSHVRLHKFHLGFLPDFMEALDKIDFIRSTFVDNDETLVRLVVQKYLNGQSVSDASALLMKLPIGDWPCDSHSHGSWMERVIKFAKDNNSTGLFDKIQQKMRNEFRQKQIPENPIEEKCQ